MESAARRVHAERNRQRLPYRSTSSRWGRRVIGVLATAGFVALGIALAMMVWPHKDSGADAFGSAALATPTPTPHHHAAKKAAHKGPTKAERLALSNAQKTLRQRGYATVDSRHYDPKAALRVLTGRPVGDAGGGTYAFFFLRGTLLGKDALSPSAKVRVVKTSRNGVTLQYGTYAAGDNACCPSGSAKVRFKLVGTQVRALDTIPSARFRGAT
jgi:hypothetical protein